MASVYPADEPLPPDDQFELPVEPVPPPKKSMNPWLIVLIVVAALIALCCLCGIAATLIFVPVSQSVVETIEPMLTVLPTP